MKNPVLCTSAKIDRPCPLWVKSGHGSAFTRCPLYPQKRTWFSAVVMSALCQKRTLLLITSSAVARADAAWPGVYGRHRLKIKEGSRGGLRSLAPLLRRANIVQAHRRSDESKMRECLREIAKLPLRRRVVFFRQQAHVIAQREQTLEQGACFGIPMLQFVIVGKPKTAREKHA